MPVALSAHKPSKSDFIRSLPATLSGPKVVAKAKAAGIKLSLQLVYAVRGRAKSKGAAYSIRHTTAPTKRSAESLLVAVGAELGLSRAVELLTAERRRVSALLGG